MLCFAVVGYGQQQGDYGRGGSSGKTEVTESDGSPNGKVKIIKFNNGSVTISGDTATVNITAVAASSADSIETALGTIDADTVVLKTRAQTITGDKTFTGTVTLPLNSITSDQISTNAVGSTEIAGSAVKESEINWNEVDGDSVKSKLGSTIPLIASDGDTNSIRAKTDKTLNLYAEQGIGFRARKSTATYPFIFSCEALGGAGDSATVMDATGRWGFRGAPDASFAANFNGSIKTSGSLFLGNVFVDNNGYLVNTSSNRGYVYCTASTGIEIANGNNASNQHLKLTILDRSGAVDNEIRLGRTATSGSYTVVDSVGRMAVGLDATNSIYDLDVDGGIRGSDTLRVGNYSTYTYIIPGGDPVKSSDETLKTAFVPLDTVLHPWELFGKAEALEIYQFKYDSAKVYERAKFDSTIYGWWNEKPADSLSTGKKDSVKADIEKKKAETKKAWDTERKEFAGKVAKATHTGPTEADWGQFMYADRERKGINSGEVMWAQMSLIKKLISEVKRLDSEVKDLKVRVDKLEGK
jgi:hypothetical protein